MVLESLVVPEKVECQPSRMLVVGFLYATVGVLLGLAVFPAHSSIASVFLTSMPLLVVMYNTLRYEEGKDCRIRREYLLMKEHVHVFAFFIYLFIGLVLGFITWYHILPPEVSGQISQAQMDEISAIRESVHATGRSVGLMAGTRAVAVSDHDFLRVILANNLKVLVFCVVFSFIYGSGAIFILTWNASVMAAALTSRFSLNYFIHGLPEILAYFTAALAGGIISVAVANHHYKSGEFKRIVVDSLDLVLLSLILLVGAGILEAYQRQIIEFFLKMIGL